MNRFAPTGLVDQVFGNSGLGHHLVGQQSWKVWGFGETGSYWIPPARLPWDFAVVRLKSYMQRSSTLHSVKLSGVEGLIVTLQVILKS